MADHRSLPDVIERRLLLGFKAAYQRLRPQTHQGCLFVAGMQRSGTNMLMDVLERSLHTRVFHESDPRAFHDYEQRDASALRALVDKGNASVTIFKALLESDRVPHLLQSFAPAKAIWAVRDYRDVINSAQRSFPHLKRTIRRVVTEPGDYWQSRGMLPDILATVKDHYDENLSIEESVALFWYARNRLYFDLGMNADQRVLLVRYEDLVTDPHQQFSSIFSFIGLPFSDWVTSKVHARSIARHQQPQLRDSIADLCETLYQRFQ